MSNLSQESRRYKSRTRSCGELKKCNHFEENQLTDENSRNAISITRILGTDKDNRDGQK